MTASALSKSDLEQLAAHGIEPGEILRQLSLFQEPAPAVVLDRPCLLGDGIEPIPADRRPELIRGGESAARQGRLTKFVPASGAASRMFKSLIDDAGEGPSESHNVFHFINELEAFPFFLDLERRGVDLGTSLTDLVDSGDYRAVVESLLRSPGLGYAELPKGLLKFHRYGDRSRSAFEEHLTEGIPYLRDSQERCRFHFTVSEAHIPLFEAELGAVTGELTGHHGARLDVTFSTQSPATDTLAVELSDEPFRLEDGSLLLRPGGHGSLIRNLGELGADIVLLKNIDNVARDRRQPLIVEWKKILTGHLVELQQGVFDLVEGLRREAPSPATLDRARRLAVDRLRLSSGDRLRDLDAKSLGAFLHDWLNRPIRVCGVVANDGEPGGGPFWVSSGEQSSRQIVEASQVDPRSESQQAMLASSTHFNPVDLVCGLRDWRGEPFDLESFVDRDAVFISRKTLAGRQLKALERPGLWNGAMARWNTIFVEVPAETFSPVKTVFDLLRVAHQPVQTARD